MATGKKTVTSRKIKVAARKIKVARNMQCSFFDQKYTQETIHRVSCSTTVILLIFTVGVFRRATKVDGREGLKIQPVRGTRAHQILWP